MSFSNYKYSTKGVGVRDNLANQLNPQRIIWVNNSSVLPVGGVAGSDANKGTYLQPMSTLTGAVGKCVSNAGDVIAIMPGHVERLTASLVALVNKNGIHVVGLGRGTKAAKFIFDHASATFTVTADDVKLENLDFIPSVTGVLVGLTVTTLSDDLVVENCRFHGRETAGDEFVKAIAIAVTCLRPTIKGCLFDADEEGAASAIEIVTPQRATIVDNVIVGDYSTSNIAFITGAGVGPQTVLRNVIVNGVTSGLNAVAAITQVAATELNLSDNVIGSDVATFALMITNYDKGVNLGNRYTDDVGGATTAVATSASVVASADA